MFRLFTFLLLPILSFECFNESKSVNQSSNDSNFQNFVDSVLAQKVYAKFCGDLESSKEKIKSSGDMLMLIPDIEQKLFFDNSTNQDFQTLVTKMQESNPNTKQNVEIAFKYILVKVIKECPTYAMGWGKRGEVKKTSILYAQDGCEYVRNQTKLDNLNPKENFYKKIELLNSYMLKPPQNAELMKLFQSYIDTNNQKEMQSFGINAYAILMTTCDDMINAYVDLTMHYAKKTISVWGDGKKQYGPPPPPKN